MRTALEARLSDFLHATLRKAVLTITIKVLNILIILGGQMSLLLFN